MGTYPALSTYRIQFRREFTLEDAGQLAGYLSKLGIRTLYASPVFQAVSGSTHGYDVTDPTMINREIGSEETFRAAIHTFHRKGIGWLQDVVPNHMAYSVENPWIFDLLLKGKDSTWYPAFDIFYDHPDKDLRSKIMLPFFGRDLDGLIEKEEITLQIGKNGPGLMYYDQVYPVSLEAFRDIDLQDLPADPGTKASIDLAIRQINRDPALLRKLVNRLSYIPVYWRRTEKTINYRRFFTINGLICLNQQDRQVFETTHQKILEWASEGLLDGLRIDHIDGLYHPSEYLEQLRKGTGARMYIAVEKILEREEQLPGTWPVQGTTGYDFLALVNNLLTQKENGPELHTFYRKWERNKQDPESLFTEKKRLILYERMGGELDYLIHLWLISGVPGTDEHDQEQLRRTIGEFMVHCTVYKFYSQPSGFSGEDKAAVLEVIRLAATSCPDLKPSLKGLKKTFLLKGIRKNEQIERIDRFFRRMMQFTGPLMAKGLEDTAYYTYNPFIAHNEVGDSPGYFGINADEFHRKMAFRAEQLPLTMNATSTHDTKRGEDTRARLNVLSDLPLYWEKAARAWRRMNKGLKTTHAHRSVPTPADEYLIYQALCGHLPMEGRPDASFGDRFKEYLLKALREGKENSSWSKPDIHYEDRVMGFVDRIMDPDHDFLESLTEFTRKIIPHGIVNSLTQLIMKNSVPGIPDTFQGCETWNLSFVDPDNRRPVDFNRLKQDLDSMIRSWKSDPVKLMESLWQHPEDGRLKQWVTHLTLQLRTKYPELFLKGSYVPLKVSGRYSSHLMAFYRNFREMHLVVAVPLHTASMPQEHRWEDTFIKLPDLAPRKWECTLTGRHLETGRKLSVEPLFRDFPFGILEGIPFQPEKRAGILMHLSSLPGDFGSGDMGPGAYAFVDFLQRAGQHFWQILPLNITGPDTYYSPYSSRSAFAGNPAFIDPEQLVREGLLEAGDLEKFELDKETLADLEGAGLTKSALLEVAFKTFKSSGPDRLREQFGQFVKKEAYWLEDYALFELLKTKYPIRSWNQWPGEYRDRNDKALGALKTENLASWERIAFEQFIFSEQWNKLKTYANDRGIDIFGDLPIYVDYESADVWAHPDLFRLKKDKTMAAVAGVPPDYFNEEGQLWGMPLYNWGSKEKELIDWWIRRIAKNLHWFDQLRLDHFRGFSSYWEVEAGAESAREGKWTPGPGTRLFEAIQQRFPEMPIVAEDLGQIDDAVIELRDRFNLPGMKVIQFGFGENMPFSTHNPGQSNYNSITYTGTHDNNTIRGWFNSEAGKKTLKRLKAYTGKKWNDEEAALDMIRLAYGSASRLVIVPMQDWLGLDEKARMNFPSTTTGNWDWRIAPDSLTPGLAKKIRKMVRTFGRY
ncbi:MAG: malto-oligosyltrehalose synthase [Bacteroidales bacterium]